MIENVVIGETVVIDALERSGAKSPSTGVQLGHIGAIPRIGHKGQHSVAPPSPDGHVGGTHIEEPTSDGCIAGGECIIRSSMRAAHKLHQSTVAKPCADKDS